MDPGFVLLDPCQQRIRLGGPESLGREGEYLIMQVVAVPVIDNTGCPAIQRLDAGSRRKSFFIDQVQPVAVAGGTDADER